MCFEGDNGCVLSTGLLHAHCHHAAVNVCALQVGKCGAATGRVCVDILSCCWAVGWPGAVYIVGCRLNTIIVCVLQYHGGCGCFAAHVGEMVVLSDEWCTRSKECESGGRHAWCAESIW